MYLDLVKYGLPWWLKTVKNLPAMQEIWVHPLGWEDPLEKEMASHSSTLAWKIPWTEEPGRLQSKGSQRVRHDWTISLYTQIQIPFFFPLLSLFEWYCNCYSAVCWDNYPFSLNYLACCWKSSDHMCKSQFLDTMFYSIPLMNMPSC